MAEKKKLNPDDIRKLEVMSAMRLPTEHMAAILGMAKDTLERRLKSNAAAREAVEKGRANASNKIRMTLFRKATEDNVTTEEKAIQVEYEEFDEKTKKLVKKWVPATEKKTKNNGPSIEAMKFWCETQEGFKRTEKLEIAKAAALDAEFEDMTDEQIMARIEKMDKVIKG